MSAQGQLLQQADQGNAEAQVNLGVMYTNGKGVAQDDRQAVAWYRKAADQGNAEAQYNLGVAYENGIGVPQDYRQAVAWYRKAADQGLAMAQLSLGMMYLNGRGVAQNYRQAVSWFQKAADQGDAGAQSNLGVMYANGKGVARNYTEAIKWYRLAAEQGNSLGQLFLGLMYWNGRGVPENDVEAYAWFLLAAANGNELATKDRDILQKTMTPNQIAVGQQQASVLQGKIEDKSKLARTPNGQAPSPDIAPSGNGSGFLIAGGYVVTCAHVVKDAQRIVIFYNGTDYPASVARQDAANDLAVLKVSGLNTGAPPLLTTKVKLGTKVFTLGFPLIDLQGEAVKFTDGTISSLSGPHDSPLYYQISVPVQPGNSGGPLFDQNGNLVGIVAARLNTNTTLAVSGDLSQNVNYAIKSNYLAPLLDTIPNLPVTTRQQAEVYELSSVVERLKPYAVEVKVY